MSGSSTIDVPSEADALLLSRRPGVEPEAADFELASVSVPAPRDGEVTVRNVLTSVDPYMLPRMQGRSSYASPFPLGEPVAADSIGEVVASAHLGVPVGSWLISPADGGHTRPWPAVRLTWSIGRSAIRWRG